MLFIAYSKRRPAWESWDENLGSLFTDEFKAPAYLEILAYAVLRQYQKCFWML